MIINRDQLSADYVLSFSADKSKIFAINFPSNHKNRAIYNLTNVIFTDYKFL